LTAAHPTIKGPDFDRLKRVVTNGGNILELCAENARSRNLSASASLRSRERSIVMFDQQYPHLAAWVLGGDAWIELGQDEMSHSMVRILDIGGLIWESDERYENVAQALAAAETALAEWSEENL
jgi:hypothetical protein